MRTRTAGGDSRDSVAKRLNEWVVLLAGILGIAVVVLGFFGWTQHSAKEDASATATDVGDELTRANTALADLQSQNGQLQDQLERTQQENASLQAAIADLQSQPESEGSAQDTGGSESINIYRQGSLSFTTNGDGADFDAPANDPQWGRDNDLISNDDLEVFDYYSAFNLDSMQIGQDASIAVLGQTAPTFDLCRTTTSYTTGTINTEDAVAGDGFCIKTSSGRYATLVVTEHVRGQLTLDVVVYNA